MDMHRQWHRRALLGFAVAGLVACGPKNSDLLKQSQAFNDQLLGQLPKLAAAVAAMPLTWDSRCHAPSKLTYSPKSDAGDTDYLMYEGLLRVGKSSEEEKSELDFHFHEGLISSYLAWADPANKYFIGRPGHASESATPLVRDIFRRVKSLKYLVVIKPQPVDRERGDVAIDTYLVDLKSLQPVCGFSVTAHADPKLGIEHYNVMRRDKKTGKETVVRSDKTDNFHGALWKDARQKVFAATQRQLQLDAPN